MNMAERNLLIVFMILTGLLIGMEAVGMDGNVLTFARYLAVILLGIAAYLKRGSSPEQKVLFHAFPLMILGDFFLVLSYSFGNFPGALRYIGFIPFAIAYLLIGSIYIKGFKWNTWLILPTTAYGLLLLAVGLLLRSYMDGLALLLGSVVLLTLTAMAWAGASAIWNGYYCRRVSIMMALSGFLMVLCDYGVAFDLFYPNIWDIRDALLINVVWLTYLPGWTILAILVIEDEIHTPVYPD